MNLPKLPAWCRRILLLGATPAAWRSWGQFWVGAALIVGVRAAVWRPAERGDPVMHWINVGGIAGILALAALSRLIDSGKTPTAPEHHWSTAGGIEVWMPLAVLGLFLLGFLVVCIATAR